LHKRRQFLLDSGDTVIDKTGLPQVDIQLLKGLEAIVVEELHNSNLTVTWLAEKTALSQRQLNRKLNQLIGLSAQQYLQNQEEIAAFYAS